MTFSNRSTLRDSKCKHFSELEAFGLVNCDFSAVIFDYDGTLVDSMWVWEHIDIDFCKRYELLLPEGYEEEIAYLSFEETAKYFCDRLDNNMTVDQVLVEFERMALREYSENVLCKPGVKNYLNLLKDRGVSIAIATSLSASLLNASLEANKIQDMFDAIALCDDCGCGKSQSDVYFLAAEKVLANPSDCLVFEDVAQGIISAQRAGMSTGAVLDRGDHQNSEQVRQLADFSIESFEQLVI